VCEAEQHLPHGEHCVGGGGSGGVTSERWPARRFWAPPRWQSAGLPAGWSVAVFQNVTACFLLPGVCTGPGFAGAAVL
jgi:hypothetical protein